MTFDILRILPIPALAFAATATPIAIENLRTGNIANRANAVLLISGLCILALGPMPGLSGFHVPAPSLWTMVAVIPVVMFALNLLGGGVAKFLIALLPWFSPREYIFVVLSGFLIAGISGAAPRRKALQVATPIVLLGLLVLIRDTVFWRG